MLIFVHPPRLSSVGPRPATRPVTFTQAIGTLLKCWEPLLSRCERKHCHAGCMAVPNAAGKARFLGRMKADECAEWVGRVNL